MLRSYVSWWWYCTEVHHMVVESVQMVESMQRVQSLTNPSLVICTLGLAANLAMVPPDRRALCK